MKQIKSKYILVLFFLVFQVYQENVYASNPEQQRLDNEQKEIERLTKQQQEYEQMLKKLESNKDPQEILNTFDQFSHQDDFLSKKKQKNGESSSSEDIEIQKDSNKFDDLSLLPKKKINLNTKLDDAKLLNEEFNLDKEDNPRKNHLEKLKNKKLQEVIDSSLQNKPFTNFIDHLTNIAQRAKNPEDDKESSENIKDNIKALINDPLPKLPILSQSIPQSSLSVSQKADKSLIQILKNKNIYSNLTPEIKNLIKNFEIQYDLEISPIENVDPQAYFDSNNITLTPNTQPFVDAQGKIGRRGFLTQIQGEDYQTQIVWIVLNNKVFCIYEQNNASIEKLYRINDLRVKDIIATPCFQIYSSSDIKQRIMLCASSILEKEAWIQTILKMQPQAFSLKK